MSASIVLAAPTALKPLAVVHDQMTIEFAPRTPAQMGSFYEARGFPKAMRDILYQQCFITVSVNNISQEKIWLDLVDWKFSVDGEPLKREHRDYWKQRWQAMGIPLSYQSTFRWTLIPETLDYLPGEQEGGNLVLPRVKGKITLDAKFKTGEDKQGEVIEIHYDQLYCAENPP
ncbi:MAG: hypothetical protein OEZ15_02200 [Gammaproteobacteria bacterium]|nr:hypothetical protein [Gammaproteobacteria bacterium]